MTELGLDYGVLSDLIWVTVFGLGILLLVMWFPMSRTHWYRLRVYATLAGAMAWLLLSVLLILSGPPIKKIQPEVGASATEIEGPSKMHSDAGIETQLSDVVTAIDKLGSQIPTLKHNDASIETQLSDVVTAIDKIGSQIPTNKEIASIVQSVRSTNYKSESNSYFELLMWISFLVFLLLIYRQLRKSKDKKVLKYERAVALAGAVVVIAGAVVAVFEALTASANTWSAWHKAINPSAENNISQIVTILPSEISGYQRSAVIVMESEAKILLSDDKSYTTFIIPFEEAGCSKVDSNGNWKGTTPIPAYTAFLRNLGADLAECHLNNDIPQVSVYGFASSSDVERFNVCDGAASSQEANLKIADKRRDEVVKLLKENGGNKLEVIPHDWNGSADAMYKERQFNDRFFDEQYSVARGVLTRRVEIRLDHLANCGITRGTEINVPTRVE